MSIEHFG